MPLRQSLPHPSPRLSVIALPLILGLSLCAAGCTRFPKVDAAVGPDAVHAPYPHLEPLSEIETQAKTTTTPPEANPADSLKAQGDALRAQAQKLYNAPAE